MLCLSYRTENQESQAQKSGIDYRGEDMKEKTAILNQMQALLCIPGSEDLVKSKKELLKRQSIGIMSVENARQLGGYVMQDGSVVRQNMLLRTAHLSTLTPDDAAILERMPVKAVVDFRNCEPGEDVVLDGAKYYRLSIIRCMPNLSIKGDPSDRMSRLLQYAQQSGSHEYYPYLLSDGNVQKTYRAFFDVLLSDEQGAVLWHCSQGKDRTGIASMMVLGALGASRETILEDFELSELVCDANAQKVMRMFEQRGVDRDMLIRLHGILSVNRQDMENVLDFIDETYGGMDAYLHKQIGLTDAEIEKLREKYLVG